MKQKLSGFSGSSIPDYANEICFRGSGGRHQLRNVMQHDLKGRLAAFNTLTPETKAEILGTHIQRWVEANRARLTPEQLELTNEWRAFATADNYRQPHSDAQRAALKEIESRSEAVFSKEQIRDALTIHGAYIPKADSRSGEAGREIRNLQDLLIS